MTAPDTVLTNARIVLPDRVTIGSLRLRDGLIAEIDEGTVSAAGDIDFAGDDLMPGVVEVHTDQVEGHFQPRPGRLWDPLPALLAHDAQMAASGTTTVLDALRIGTEGDGNPYSAAVGAIIAAIDEATSADLLRAEHLVHLRCEVSTSDVIEVFDGLADSPHIRMLSLMDHTPGERQYADLEAYKKSVLAHRRGLDPAALEAHIAEQKVLSVKYARPHRTALAERASRLGVVTATHDDATLDHVAESAGLGVVISEFPTTVDAARAARAAGQAVVMGAPNIVRGGSHSGNVAALELLKLGLLDILSSDYVPSSTLQAVYLAHAHGVISLSEGAALASANPARAVGLDDRGTIEVGRRADLVRIKPHDAGGAGTIPVVRGVWRRGERVA